ncbi:MAG TPA: response regulator [Verrucomicrobiae bacterium]|nr:response regulator [Verrucomicrobiae bacterium]
MDDLEDDQVILERMLRRALVSNRMVKLTNGVEAIRYLKGDGPYKDRNEYPLPVALFLDLKMPLMGGWEVLEWMSDFAWQRVMGVFVYSELEDMSEVRRLFTFGIDYFLPKSFQENNLLRLMNDFPKPWDLKLPPEIE